ncbi:HD-like signal output (HDOD) domain, no enzymatic activity [Desulfacinum hydrothermale DSM 13146]|uniref:HD-like signal output (HDOD) domain, no enzymatic activity n=2 Tax=Desulfacinum hydrothermale TaxID=109258 RepID=A0A1W1WYB9_9BACT|nr:HD-like signal output (HDOD) domain, no enzymatic activity [Desulfacinum hydrothermale DSM 13146]
MGLFAKLRRHAAVATGNFAAMFQKVEIPPLPAAVSRLVAEANKPEPDFDVLAELISSTTGLAAKVIQTVNSPLYGLQRPVTNVRQAVTFLGIRNIRSLALAYATMSALPSPRDSLFDEEAFWADSLLHALLARALCAKRFQGSAEDAFTAGLLAHVALPVLLTVWGDYYRPIVSRWGEASVRLSALERGHFGWDHAQAGAWIVQYWEFPEELVCYIGAHNLDLDDLERYELQETVALPLAVAALAPSLLKTDPERIRAFRESACRRLGLDPATLAARLEEVKDSFHALMGLFGLQVRGAEPYFQALETAQEAVEEVGHAC